MLDLAQRLTLMNMCELDKKRLIRDSQRRSKNKFSFFRLEQLLETHQKELAEVLVREHEKTLAEANDELRRGIENVEVACWDPVDDTGRSPTRCCPRY
ncbi:MAG: hypothetical protein J07HQW2_03585 [Haloquadratum walsbyi J07HQW2]|jgi:methylmalonate-semialdehyde dehydrogenase [acylating] (EC 1.2.1.27)|uniref:Uncharacterized protein n=1 Tax=Haloquadratum walsbyi J07HQW2 TaxID=1238425 RepID=U1N2J1_9EURY|nr:MAG: hypothetical protein J07HQW2_03585 [Haloquadratum walsbyi J07HQW2]